MSAGCCKRQCDIDMESALPGYRLASDAATLTTISRPDRFTTDSLSFNLDPLALQRLPDHLVLSMLHILASGPHLCLAKAGSETSLSSKSCAATRAQSNGP